MANMVVLLPHSYAHADNRIELKIGLIIFPPLVMKQRTGECYGSGIEQLKSIFPQREYKVRIYCASPARVYRDFDNGDIDITVNVKTTPSLAEQTLFSAEPFEFLHVMLYETKLEPMGTIAAIGEFDYHGAKQALKLRGYNFLEQANSREAIAVFLRGDAQAVISYKMPYEYYFESFDKGVGMGGATENISVSELLRVPTYVVINKRSSHALNILERVNGSIR